MKEENLDTIRIELVVSASSDYEDEVVMYGNLEIYINQRKPYDESSDIIDLENLLKSMDQGGEYYIFSCCCGVPQCSGWERGIKVMHDAHQIRWVNENSNESWTFDKKSINEQLKTIKEEAIFYKLFFKKKDIDYVGVGYNWE